MKKPECPTIIDIEASGFGSASYPIEIGAVKSNGDRYCALIKPAPGWDHWCANAEKIHGISRALIETHGKSSLQVCEELNIFLQETTAYSDAWTHDNPWLIHLFFSARMMQSFRLSAIENIAREEQLLLWDATKIQLRHNLNIPRHRASGDAYLIQQTYIETNRLLAEKSSVNINND